MADVKWIKITTDMFDNRKIKHLRKLPDGNNIVLIWVMLLTMAGRCNSCGKIYLTENIPYTPKMLADELDFEENTVKLALEALEQLNMIVTDGKFFSISGWEEHQNIEGMERIREQNRIRKQRQRAKAAIPESCPVTSRDSHATDIEKEEERDNRLDIEGRKSVRETTRTLFERLAPDYFFTDAIRGKLSEWITYKIERKESYKEQGMKSLLRRIETAYCNFGEEAVCNLIDECMASNWKGIIFDRLKNNQVNQPRQSNRRNGNVFLEMLEDES